MLQTGIQILTGFLLTLPFQQRFAVLSGEQVALYLCLVTLSVLITALLLSTVVLHRTFFQHRIKPDLVHSSDQLLRITLVLVGLVLIGTVWLVFDIVLVPGAGPAAALVVTVVLSLLWILFPLTVRRRALRRRLAATAAGPGRPRGGKRADGRRRPPGGGQQKGRAAEATRP